MPLFPLLLVGGGALLGFGSFYAVDKTADSITKATTSTAALLIVGGALYLIAKKQKLI